MTRKSPNLEVVSKQDNSGFERRRVPRLNLTTDQFKLSQNGKLFSVYDLSAHGMALRIIDAEDFYLFPVGSHFEGVLNLRGDKLRIKAQVRHLGQDLIGTEFESLDTQTIQFLETRLDPELLGKDLKPLPSTDSGATWYHGSSGTDLLLWRAIDGSYHRFSAFVLGSYIQWEQEAGVTTGRVNFGDTPAEVWGAVRFETVLLKADPQPDPAKLMIAKTLIMSSNLPQDLKKWCVRMLGGSNGS